MKFDWNPVKNELLKLERGVSFEVFQNSIENNEILAVEKHHNTKKYPHQLVYVIEFNDYAYLVPFVKDGNTIFLKTIIPSRRATKKYLHQRR